MSPVHGILPAAGVAIRLRGLPKFSLPIDSSFTTLLEWHVGQMLEVVDTIYIPIRAGTRGVLESLDVLSRNVIAVEVETATMTQSVIAALERSTASRFLLGMPDTWFSASSNVYEKLITTDSEVAIACFPIRPDQVGKVGQVDLEVGAGSAAKVARVVDKNPNCTFQHLWGAVNFGRELMALSFPEDPHIGQALARWVDNDRAVSGVVAGDSYFDCGTGEEYWRLLARLLR